MYAEDLPPKDYDLGVEVDGIVREADAHSFDRFHLVGYSGGGAAALAFLAEHGDRLLSVALLEPAWAGNDRTPEEEALWLRLRALEALQPDRFIEEFVRLQMAPGVPLPPRPQDPPPWMAKRPAGIRALIGRSTTATSTSKPSGRSTGRSTSPSAVIATPTTTRGSPTGWRRVLPDLTIETFAERHHFDPPHRKEPDRLARSLLTLWRRADP